MSREDALLRWLTIAWHRGVQEGKALQAATAERQCLQAYADAIEAERQLGGRASEEKPRAT